METNRNPSQTLANNNIKHTEAQQLNAYLDTLTYWERVEFVSCVVKAASVKRQTFFNWKCMACRIPDYAKQIIEDEAGEHIFVDMALADEQQPQP